MNGKVVLIAVSAVIVVIGFAGVMSYNGIVSASIAVDEAQGNVQAQYQRRYDLIPKVVDSTKLYINYESKLLTDIAAARSGWTSSLNQGFGAQQQAQGQMDSVLNRLLAVVVVENYPDLKGNQIVLSLIDELEGTENRISVARMRYNEAVSGYNRMIQSFPGMLIAGFGGFQPRSFYQAAPGTDQYPEVSIK